MQATNAQNMNRVILKLKKKRDQLNEQDLEILIELC